MSKLSCYKLIKAYPDVPRAFFRRGFAGITIIEALMAMMVVAIAGAAALVTYNGLAAFLYRTDRVSKINVIIDNDIARIREISQNYNACGDPSGSIDQSACRPDSGTELNTENYFPASPEGIDEFQAACRSDEDPSHITSNFIDLISPSPVSLDSDPVAGQIDKQVRRASGISDDYTVIVSYTAPYGIDRREIVTPYLTYWCPT